MKQLESMSFSITCDKELNPETMCLTPGGYVLNGKDFDFRNSKITHISNSSNPFEYRCVASDFDEEFFEDAKEDNEGKYKGITEKDVRYGEFSEFFIYNGENGDEFIKVLHIFDLEFEFDDGTIIRPKNNSKIKNSANRYKALNRTE